jgi:hypothetical protein
MCFYLIVRRKVGSHCAGPSAKLFLANSFLFIFIYYYSLIQPPSASDGIGSGRESNQSPGKVLGS